MINYTAPNPYPAKTNWFSIFSNNCSSLTSTTPQKPSKLAKIILLAQNREHSFLEPSLDKEEFEVDTGIVRTFDDTILDTFQVTPRAIAATPVTDRFYVIKFNGNNTLLEDKYEEFAQDAKALQASVVGFDYRGVGRTSKHNPPQVFQDLVTDGIAQVQRLLDLGVDSKKITLDGMSLGGAIAVLVAHHFHKKNLPLYLWVDRSFSSISRTGAAMFAPTVHPLLAPLVLGTMEVASWVVTKSAGWEENIAHAYLEIPEAYKAYLTVAKTSNKTGSKGDEVIAPSASLHKSVKHLEKTRTGNTVLSLSTEGHCVPRSWLQSKKNPAVNGQQLFENFVKGNRLRR